MLGLSVLSDVEASKSDTNESYVSDKKGNVEIVLKALETKHMAHAGFPIGHVPHTGVRVMIKGVIGSRKTSLGWAISLGATLGPSGDFSDIPCGHAFENGPEDYPGDDWRVDFHSPGEDNTIDCAVGDKTYDFSLVYTCTDRGYNISDRTHAEPLDETDPLLKWGDTKGEGNRFGKATHLWLSSRGGTCKITTVVLNYPVPLRRMPGPSYPGAPKRGAGLTALAAVEEAAVGIKAGVAGLKKLGGVPKSSNPDASPVTHSFEAFSTVEVLIDSSNYDSLLDRAGSNTSAGSTDPAASHWPQWACATCTYINASGLAPVCEMCGTPRGS